MSMATGAGTVAGASASRMLDNVSPGGVSGIAAGALVVGGLIGHATTRTDGSRRVSRRHASDYTLRPRSKDAARKSLEYQRLFGAAGAIGGAATLAYSLSTLSKTGSAGVALIGAGFLGWGAARLLKLHGAEDELPDALPEDTPAGESDMERSGYTSYGLFGETHRRPSRGYDVYGWPTGSPLAPSAPVINVQPLPTSVQPLPTSGPLLGDATRIAMSLPAGQPSLVDRLSNQQPG